MTEGSREVVALANALATYEWMQVQCIALAGALPALMDAAARQANAEGYDIRACTLADLHTSCAQMATNDAAGFRLAGKLHCELIDIAGRLGIKLPPPQITPPTLPPETKSGR